MDGRGPRAALVTGASSGIGLAVAHVLGEEGYALTVSGRRADKLEAAAAELADRGYDVAHAPANVVDDDDVRALVALHRERRGRLDVLVNNAGMGIGGRIGDIASKHVDLQLAINLRSVMVFYRETLDLLRRAGAEHGNALVVNTSSLSGKRGEGGLSVYSAAKHGVVGFTQAMNRELEADGIKSCALCPGYVDTPLTDYIKDEIPSDDMIRSGDIAEAVRFLTRLSPHCVVPEIIFTRPGDRP
jgi:NAD(P)-dependent dehydrogenase (short-subunit alcohol dehydrogenase family)